MHKLTDYRGSVPGSEQIEGFGEAIVEEIFKGGGAFLQGILQIHVGHTEPNQQIMKLLDPVYVVHTQHLPAPTVLKV